MEMSSDIKYSEMFNKYLKGKYAYWIQMRYIVSFELMGHEGYVACEEDITKLLKKADGTYPIPYGCPYIDMYDQSCNIIKYIDIEATEKANNNAKFHIENENSSDNDPDINELKNFRTWLATAMLERNIDGILDEMTVHMLEYYKGGMYNEVVKYLTLFNNYPELSQLTSSCSCCEGTSLNSLYNTSINQCNPLTIYKKNIFNKMVEVFSSIDFWMLWSEDFLIKFKTYIDKIIKYNFKINTNNSIDISIYKDCTCNNTNQNNNNEILRRLSESLNYMINSETNAHKNYIKDSLYSWSSLLYEYMQW